MGIPKYQKVCDNAFNSPFAFVQVKNDKRVLNYSR
jgi:hypothetical protein